MVDKALLLRKLAELEEYLGQIREYTNITIEQYSRKNFLITALAPFD